jgi:hypothetical protein
MDNKNRRNKKDKSAIFQKKNRMNKRGLSVIIGYVLLIVISIVMSIIVFAWLKTYVPSDSLQCSDGTSLLIQDVSYNCTSMTLTATLVNNGKFSIDGYFIHASNMTNQELSAIDLSSNIIGGGNFTGNAVTFDLFHQNAMNPGDKEISSFNISGHGILYKIEMIPTRIQEQDGKNRFVSCSDAKADWDLTCIT